MSVIPGFNTAAVRLTRRLGPMNFRSNQGAARSQRALIVRQPEMRPHSFGSVERHLQKSALSSLLLISVWKSALRPLFSAPNDAPPLPLSTCQEAVPLQLSIRSLALLQ